MLRQTKASKCKRDSSFKVTLFLSLSLSVCLCVGVDVRWSDGGHPLLQGRTHLQEVRPLQGPWWDQLGKGNSSRRVPLRFMAKHNAADPSRIFCILQQSDTGGHCQDCAVTSPASHLSYNTTMNYIILEVNRNQWDWQRVRSGNNRSVFAVQRQITCAVIMYKLYICCPTVLWAPPETVFDAQRGKWVNHRSERTNTCQTAVWITHTTAVSIWVDQTKSVASWDEWAKTQTTQRSTLGLYNTVQNVTRKHFIKKQRLLFLYSMSVTVEWI